MPLNRLARRIKKKMEAEYGKKKGNQVFYASMNTGKLPAAAKEGK